MMKATVTLDDGRTLLLIGLSFGNLDRFRSQPLDSFISIKGEEVGIPVDVMLFAGETEAALMDFMSRYVGPDTEVSVSERLKS